MAQLKTGTTIDGQVAHHVGNHNATGDPHSQYAPVEHALGGANHATDTLANLNVKISDATLDDSSASRTPLAHGNEAHSTNFAAESALTAHENDTNNPHNVTAEQVGAVGLVGEIVLYGATSVPTGFLACDGAAVSRSTYADLFDVLGTTWGEGDGSTTFGLPDLRDALPMGRSATRAIATTDGSLEHGHTQDGTGNAGSHLHSTPSTGSSGGHAHTNPSTGTAGSHSHSVGDTGSTGAHTHTSARTDGPNTTVGVASGSNYNVGSSGHTHNVSTNTGSVASHAHSNPTTGSQTNHGHSVGDTGSVASHSHSIGNTGTEADHSHTNPTTANTDHLPPVVMVQYLIRHA